MIKPKPAYIPDASSKNCLNQFGLWHNSNRLLSKENVRNYSFALMSKFLMLALLLIISFTSTTFAQEVIEVRGKVVSADDQSELIGANVFEKGTLNNGASTDFNGEFTLRVPIGATLVVSYIGFEKTEVKVVGKKTLLIELNQETLELESAVVVGIGYGKIKKADATGSVTAISPKDFNQGSIASPQELLIGKASGVVASTLGGSAGAGTKIRIRGGSSITGNNDPLIVVDNIPLESSGISGMANPLSTINPNDIESISILKDASATAIYGSRASNGVIIITTKKGKIFDPNASSKLTVNYNGNVSLATPADLLEVFSGDEFRSIIKDRVDNYGLTAEALNRLGNANTDWQDEIYENAFSTDHNLSFNHAISGIPYRVSLGYLRQGGILKYNSIDRKNVSFATSPSLFDGALDIDLNASLSLIDNNFSNTDAIGSALQFDPSQPIKNGNKRYGGYTAWTLLGEGIDGTPINIATHNPVETEK